MYEDYVNIEIGGFQFVAEELKAEQSQPSREVTTTKIFNGTSFVTQGDYLPMSWTFTSYMPYSIESPSSGFNGMIKYLESGPMEVFCPLIGDKFTAAVRVVRNVQGSGLMKLEFTLTEAPDVSNYTVDNFLYKYNHLTIQEIHDQQE